MQLGNNTAHTGLTEPGSPMDDEDSPNYRRPTTTTQFIKFSTLLNNYSVNKQIELALRLSTLGLSCYVLHVGVTDIFFPLGPTNIPDCLFASSWL